MIDRSPARRRSSPFLRHVAIGLIVGTATGLFLGDRARVFQVVADGFVKMLQMAVLPYITVSIIGSIGGLRLEDLRTLGLRAGLVLAGLWGVAFTFAFLMPLTFPPAASGTFFSTTIVERPPPFNLIDLYVPSNPFFALANNVVPAVVLFSIVVGIALISVPRKRALLELLETASDALARAMRFVVRLTPYGVLAIAATTAGTLRIEQAGRLEVYLIGYGSLALLLGLWVLPGLISTLTSIPIRTILGATHEALLTAVIAGDLFIVLPVLVGACKSLVARFNSEASQTLPDVIVPIAFNFPHSGKLLSISFILFAAWFSDAAIDPVDYPRLGLAGLVTLFGSTTAAVPFLLDLFRVPADTFQLFLASGVINSRFGTLVAAMHTVTVALLATFAVSGALRWRLRSIARYLVITVALTVSVIGGVRLGAAAILGEPSAGDVLAGMTLDERVEAVVYRSADAVDIPWSADNRLETIATRRLLRVGYLSDALPFAFFNAHDDLVGFDSALMHRLAIELGVRLAFVPLERERLDEPSGAAELLQQGYCDIIIGGIAVTTRRAGLMLLSSTYLDETLGFVVHDDARRRFDSWDSIRESGALTIAAPNVPYYVDALRKRLPEAQFRTVQSIGALFHPALADVDALALPAERGAAWTLRYPQYAVVVPSPDLIKIPLAYALPRGEHELSSFVNTWIDLKRRDGTIDGLYQYWILGRHAARAGPRWSIMSDVLHWVE